MRKRKGDCTKNGRKNATEMQNNSIVAVKLPPNGTTDWQSGGNYSKSDSVTSFCTMLLCVLRLTP